MWWHRRGFHAGFRFGFPPFMFFMGSRSFPSKEEYSKMLDEYKKELEKELQEIDKELEELKKS